MSIKFQQISFIQSASRLSQCPFDRGIEVAMIGRSNAGKSSALNSIGGQKNLAKTSKLPGYTRLINLFAVDVNRRLVDLPGYGYAKVSHALKAEMEDIINEYLTQRACLYGVFLLMDIRHPFQESDQACLNVLYGAGKHVHLILTKCDKLSRARAQDVLSKARAQIAPYNDMVTIQNFSALSGEGLDEMRGTLERWFAQKIEQ